MKLGFPTHPRHDPCDEVRWIAANGFDFVDLFLEPDRGALDAVDVGALRAVLHESGLDAVGHTAWYLPIGSPMDRLREVAVALCVDYLHLFARLDIRSMTVHANWPGSMFSDQEGIAFQVESLRPVVEAADTLGMRVLYEPVPTARDSSNNVAGVLDAVPGLRCHLDLGHCHVVEGDAPAMIRRFAGRLDHLHAHDNMGDSDLHLPPGTGGLAWDDVFRALADIRFQGTMTLEVFSPEREYALLARDLVRRWMRKYGLSGTDGCREKGNE